MIELIENNKFTENSVFFGLIKSIITIYSESNLNKFFSRIGYYYSCSNLAKRNENMFDKMPYYKDSKINAFFRWLYCLIIKVLSPIYNVFSKLILNSKSYYIFKQAYADGKTRIVEVISLFLGMFLLVHALKIITSGGKINIFVYVGALIFVLFICNKKVKTAFFNSFTFKFIKYILD